MDKVTKYLLIHESTVDKLTNSLKVILPNVQASLLKVNINMMKKIASRLPHKNIKDVEKDAIRQIPGFKNNLAEAKIKLTRTKIFDNYTQKPAAIVVALVSSTTKNSVEDVIKKGEIGVRNSKLLPIPGYFTLIKLGLFATFIAGMFLSDGAILMPTVQLALKAMGLLFATLSSILTGASEGMKEIIEPGGSIIGKIVSKSFSRPEADPATIAAVQKFANPIPNELMSAHDLSSVGKFLSDVDPLGIN